MTSAWPPFCMKYSPIAQPAYGARNCSGAGSGAVGLERCLDLGNLLGVLPDRHIDADDPGVILVDDRVDGDRGLPGLAITDDQLALTAADRDHRVDGFETGLQRRVDVLA